MWYVERRPFGATQEEAVRAGFTERTVARDALLRMFEDEIAAWRGLDPELADELALHLPRLKMGATRIRHRGITWQMYREAEA